MYITPPFSIILPDSIHERQRVSPNSLKFGQRIVHEVRYWMVGCSHLDFQIIDFYELLNFSVLSALSRLENKISGWNLFSLGFSTRGIERRWENGRFLPPSSIFIWIDVYFGAYSSFGKPGNLFFEFYEKFWLRKLFCWEFLGCARYIYRALKMAHPIRKWVMHHLVSSGASEKVRRDRWNSVLVPSRAYKHAWEIWTPELHFELSYSTPARESHFAIRRRYGMRTPLDLL